MSSRIGSRIEKDFLGTVRVPADAYYGCQTQRALANSVSGKRFPSHFISSYAMIKRVAALANVRAGKLDRKKGGAIAKACGEVMKGKFDDQFPVDVYQAGAGTSTNMNLNEVVANRATELLGGRKGQYTVHPNDDVNMSQSTNDTFHSAMHVAACALCTKELLPAAGKLYKSLARKSSEFKNIPKTGRTHLRNAVPITLGQEFSGYATAIGKCIKKIENARDSLLKLNLGGTAVGTGLNAGANYKKNIYHMLNAAARMKFVPADNIFEATQNISAALETSAAIRHLATDLMKICSDLRTLSSEPFGEIILPDIQPGSSAMPGKVNPSIPELAEMGCIQCVGNDTAVAAAAARGQLELNAFMPVACYNLLDSLNILANTCNILAGKCIGGIRANQIRIKEHLERNSMAAAALVPLVGYEKAAEIARKSARTGKSVREICTELKLMPEKELGRILDIAAQTKRK